MFKKATEYTVKTGKGYSTISKLNAIDKAMVDASIGRFNLIKVSSVLPVGIKKVQKIYGDIGELKPAVISKVTAKNKELVAGLGWGTRKDGSGYVMEHSSVDDKVEVDSYKKELEDKLHEMEKCRNIEFENTEYAYEKVDAKKDEYGCAFAALVYL